ARIVRARTKILLARLPGVIEIDEDEIRRRADGEASRLEAKDFGRALRHGPEQGQQLDLAGMDKAQGGSEQRFEADGAVRGFGERLPLDLAVLRVMIGMDDVDGAVVEPGDQRLPVVFRAERGRQLEEGAVAADIILVERQIVD